MANSKVRSIERHGGEHGSDLETAREARRPHRAERLARQRLRRAPFTILRARPSYASPPPCVRTFCGPPPSGRCEESRPIGPVRLGHIDAIILGAFLERYSITLNRHCEERSDEAIQGIGGQRRWPWIASLRSQ